MSFLGLLKYINSLPFSLTIKHYFVFTDPDHLKDQKLDSKESWDLLREQDPHFSISERREEWLLASEALIKKDGQDGGLIARAKKIVDIANQNHVTSMFSAGSGGAGLEYQIKKHKPDMRMVVSEYSQVAVQRLKKVFHEADDVVLFDIKSKDWSIALRDIDPQEHLVLLYRVDIHFTDEELRNIFHNMYTSGIQNILIILCGTLTLRGLYNRLWQRLLWVIGGVKFVFAGFLRSKDSFPVFWNDLYIEEEIDFAGLKGFLLTASKKV